MFSGILKINFEYSLVIVSVFSFKRRDELHSRNKTQKILLNYEQNQKILINYKTESYVCHLQLSTGLMFHASFNKVKNFWQAFHKKKKKMEKHKINELMNHHFCFPKRECICYSFVRVYSYIERT